MTEWNAGEYARRSGLQQAMAEEVLALLHLQGSERILDVGCGNGRTTAEIAARVPSGSVLGVDPSRSMIDFASTHFGPAVCPNLLFRVEDARTLPFQQEFDLTVSFNALHWVPQQEKALASIYQALKPGGTAQLRLVPKGERTSIEDVLEETRLSTKWSRFFTQFEDPYLHLTPDEYARLAQHSGFEVQRVHTADKSWDFDTREAFLAFGSATMVEWTRRLTETDCPQFINDVLDRYASIAADKPDEQNTFKFYQMDITLLRPRT